MTSCPLFFAQPRPPFADYSIEAQLYPAITGLSEPFLLDWEKPLHGMLNMVINALLVVIIIIIIMPRNLFNEAVSNYMAAKLKVRKIGSSQGVIIPKEELARLRVSEGDELYMVSDADGLRLQPYDPEFEEQMEAYESVARQYRNAFRELAK